MKKYLKYIDDLMINKMFVVSAGFQIVLSLIYFFDSLKNTTDPNSEGFMIIFSFIIIPLLCFPQALGAELSKWNIKKHKRIIDYILLIASVISIYFVIIVSVKKWLWLSIIAIIQLVIIFIMIFFNTFIKVKSTL